MVEYPSSLDRTLSAIADPTRRAILSRLAAGRARITEIAVPFHMSLNAISKHVRVLENAGLVRREISGREHYCSLQADPLRNVQDWLNFYADFWKTRLDALERHVTAQRKLVRKEKKDAAKQRQIGSQKSDSSVPRRAVRRMDKSR